VGCGAEVVCGVVQPCRWIVPTSAEGGMSFFLDLVGLFFAFTFAPSLVHLTILFLVDWHPSCRLCYDFERASLYY
jgi:hypothetical protein